MSRHSDSYNSGQMKLKLDNYVRRSIDGGTKKHPVTPITEKQKEWLAYTCFPKCRDAFVRRMTQSALLSDFENRRDLVNDSYINMWNILHKFDISYYIKNGKSKIADQAFFDALEQLPPYHRTETVEEKESLLKNKKPVLDDEGNPIIKINKVEKIIPFTTEEREMFTSIGQIIVNYQKGKINDYKSINKEQEDREDELREMIAESGEDIEIPKKKRLTLKDCKLMKALKVWIKDEKELKKSYKIIANDKIKAGFFDTEGKNAPKVLEFFFTNYYYGRVNYTALEARKMKKERGTGPVQAFGDEIPYNPSTTTSDFLFDPTYEITANLKYELDKEDDRFRRFFTELYIIKSLQREMREDYSDFRELKQRCDAFIKKVLQKYRVDYPGANGFR